VHEAFLAKGDLALADLARPEPRRAARRMRALGVPAGQAERFGGDPLFEGIWD
jgi:hypothetical protein